MLFAKGALWFLMLLCSVSVLEVCNLTRLEASLLSRGCGDKRWRPMAHGVFCVWFLSRETF